MGCYPLQSITLKLEKLRNDEGDNNNTLKDYEESCRARAARTSANIKKKFMHIPYHSPPPPLK